MKLQIHSVCLAASSGGRSAAQALQAGDLGLVAVAHAETRATLVAAELGAVASTLVLETVRSHVAKSIEDLRQREPDQERAALDVLRTAAHMAGKELQALAMRQEQPIECTLDVALILNKTLYVCHIGDGAVFLLRLGLVHKLTQEHLLSPEPGHSDSARAPRSRALGVSPMEVETMAVSMGSSDRVLLASPWICHALDDLRIREVATDPSADGMSSRLLSAARERAAGQDLAVCVVLPGSVKASHQAPGGRLETLARTPLFAYCTERELISLAGITRPAHFLQGQLVFKQAETGHSMYLMVAGAVRVERDGQLLTELGPGANFGEMALLDQPHRSATVTALEPSEALEITREAFFALLKREPTLAVKVLWNMLLRLSANLRTTSEKLATLEGRQ